MSARRTWRRTLLLTATIAVSSCVFEFPQGISDSEIRRLGISDGIAGKAFLKDGVCSPGFMNCVGGTCALQPVPGDLIVLGGGEPVGASEDGGFFSDCIYRLRAGRSEGLGIQASGLASRELLRASLRSGEFGVSLDAGAYVLVVADSSGCTRCVVTAANNLGTTVCGPTVVMPKNVTKADIFLDYSVW